ncbi:acyltransferase [Vibrio makurazakiensis]|uniref:acyltransferase n=1 Tax=Vibrio makurazakiensis TaxID=2910250 RepID=UPI003D0A7C62
MKPKDTVKNNSSLKHHLRNKFRVEKYNQVNISDKAKVRDCKISIKGSNNRLIIEGGVNLRGSFIEIDGIGCTIHISKDCIIGDNCYLSARERGISLVLGEGCMLSRNIKLMTSDGHNISRKNQRINPAKSITISNQVWLADSVTILKGVTVGEGSIVGINSTLTKSIGHNQVAVGNPAKVVISETSWQHELTFKPQ